MFKEVNVCIKRRIITYKICWEDRVTIGRFGKEEGIVLLKLILQLRMLKVLVWENCISYAFCLEEKNS